MKYFFIVFFIFLFGCSSTNKVYMCGDRPCVDKKEFKAYFTENLTIEVQTKTDKKNNTIDLVKLNTNTNAPVVASEPNVVNEKAIIKAEKNRLKEEKKRLIEERKIKEKEEKRLAKLNKKNKEAKEVKEVKEVIKKDNTQQKIVKSSNIEKIKKITKNEEVEDANSICEIITDCDIDKIAELLIKKGREKDFPDITAN
jgi:hypothetical protein